MRVLSSPGYTERKKKYAFIALEKLTNRFKKMTKNWESLTFKEKAYYQKLIPLIFSDKDFKPSTILSHEAMPFQNNW